MGTVANSEQFSGCCETSGHSGKRSQFATARGGGSRGSAVSGGGGPVGDGSGARGCSYLTGFQFVLQSETVCLYIG